jgi:hypothetical protein
MFPWRRRLLLPVREFAGIVPLVHLRASASGAQLDNHGLECLTELPALTITRKVRLVGRTSLVDVTSHDDTPKPHGGRLPGAVAFPVRRYQSRGTQQLLKGGGVARARVGKW